MGHVSDWQAGLNCSVFSNNTENDTKSQSMREECQRTPGGHIGAPSKQLGACAQAYTWHPPSPEPLS